MGTQGIEASVLRAHGKWIEFESTGMDGDGRMDGSLGGWLEARQRGLGRRARVTHSLMCLS